MQENAEIKPISMRCKICGGTLVNDWLGGACVCENCGNKWSLSDMVPNFSDYSRVIEKIKRAKDLLNDTDSAASAGQALVMFKSAESDCRKFNDAVGAELAEVCKEGRAQASVTGHYATAKSYLAKENYRRARDEFMKADGFKDSEELLTKCEEGAKIQQRKRIPYAVIIGMILPLILSIFVHETAGLPLWSCVLIFIVCWAGAAFAVYLDGTISILIEIFSYVVSVPLLLDLILAYGFHMDHATALKISVGVPLLIVAVIAVLAERKN